MKINTMICGQIGTYKIWFDNDKDKKQFLLNLYLSGKKIMTKDSCDEINHIDELIPNKEYVIYSSINALTSKYKMA